jgi:hypothetical protein
MPALLQPFHRQGKVRISLAVGGKKVVAKVAGC